MKQKLLILIALLPLVGLSQSTLSKWVYADYTATSIPAEITGYNFTTVGGPTLGVNNYGPSDTFYETGSWPNQNAANSPDLGKYIQFRIKADNNFIIKPSSFNFKARLTGGSASMMVKCAKNADFTDSVQNIIGATSISGNTYTTYNGNFPANYSSAAGGFIYVRIYVYYTYNAFHIQYDLENVGPTINGTVVSSLPVAVNDNITTSKNTSTAINVIGNDFPGTGTIASVGSLTTPTNGATVSVNPDKTIQFTPATNFLGTSSFKYTISGSQGGSNNTSTATVTVTVAEAPLVEWDLTADPNVSSSQPYVTGTSILFGGSVAAYSNNGMNIAQFNNTDFAHFRYFDIRVKPKTGKSAKVTNLVFNQARLTAGSFIGASNYQVKYKIVSGTFSEDESIFFNTATVLVTDESITDNPIVNKPLDVTLSDTQTLVVRIYGRNANSFDYKGWNIKPNTLKLRGYEITPCVSSTAPSSIVGGNVTVCPNTSVTLTASGGTLGTDATYEWGKGAVNNANIIPGQNGVSITVSQSEASATYWVRRKNSIACGAAVTGVASTTITTAVPGTPTVYGTDKWIGYVYTYSGAITTTPSTTNYIGFVTESNLEFNRNNAENSAGGTTVNLCSNPNNNFWIRYRRTINFTAGTYTLTVGGDDGYRLSVDGGASWIINNWTSHIYTTSTTQICLSGSKNVVLEYFDTDGPSRISFASTNVIASPTSLSGNNTICQGSSTVLTANGVTVDGINTFFQWGTGTVGSNIIAGETTNSITVFPSTTTDYWVRVRNTLCTTTVFSAGVSRTVSVTPSATAPTSISGIETSYCPSGPVTLTATGGSGATYQWGTGTVGNNIITGQNTSVLTISPASTTTYWVRRVNNIAPCTGFTNGATKTINVLPTPEASAEFGNNEWKVYGYNSGGNSNPTDYRGFYVQNLGANLGLDTKLKWDAQSSPSAASDWKGCTVNNDNFTMVHKRKGFPCGRYQLAFLYYDDDTAIIIKDANGVTTNLNFMNFYNGGTALSQPINGTNSFALDANSSIEIRTTDTGGFESKLGVTFTKSATAVYSDGVWLNNTNPSYTDIEVQGNLNLAADLTVCTCTVKPNYTLTVPENKTLTVIGNTIAEGTGKFIIENNGAFVQVDENSTYTGIPTSFTSKRKTQPVFRFDFTYWSSPVEDFILKNVSPISLFDKFFSWNSTTQAWLVHKTNLAPHQMIAGKGYTIRAPQNFDIEGATGAVAKIHEAQFIGKPNTGKKLISVSNGAANRYNLIGNPYPSAISVLEFLKLNKDVIDGTLYFWTHKSPVIQNSPNPDYAVYSSTDYVAVNLSGSVKNQNNSSLVTTAPDDNSLGLGQGSSFDNIASGQSFFIKGKETGVTGNEVTFNNAMRVREGKKNNQFFKPGVTNPVKDWEITGKHRIWLNITTAQNDLHQTLVGYIQDATNGLDWGYDGEVFSGGNITLYSLLDTKALSIQARALPFSAQDQVPLGYATTQTGTMTISIDHLDGLFSGQSIYLEDKVLNVVHNLKNSSYSFTSAAGTFNSRFVLRYLPQENLATEIPTLDANSIVIFSNNSQISIKVNDLNIDQILIYDLSGRTLFTKNNVNASEFTTSSLTANNQVVLVKITTDTKAELVKKVILK